MMKKIATLLLAAGLYMPAAQGQNLDPAQVTLPWNDFYTLFQKGMAPERRPDPAPTDYTISRAQFEGRVEGESALFDATLHIKVLKDRGWSSVPLLPATVALKDATLDGKLAPIFIYNGWYTLITDKPGDHKLTLTYASQVWESSGQFGFTYDLPNAGATAVKLTVPGKDTLDFNVSNAKQLTRSQRGDSQIIDALLPATSTLNVNWQRAAIQDEAVDKVARVYAEHHSLIGVGEGLLQGTSVVNYSVLHHGVDQFDLSLPDDVVLLSVEGKGIKDWKAVDEAGRKKIHLDLNFEAMGPYRLVLKYERPLNAKDTSLNLPTLQLAETERVKGYVGVDARSSLEINGDAPVGARLADVRDLPASLLGLTDWPILLAYTYRTQDYQIPITLRQHEAVDMLVTLIDQAQANTVLTPSGRRMTQITYAMRNNSAQFLKLKLPEGAIPWSTFVAGKAVKPGRDENGQILIPLTRSQTSGGALSSFSVEMVYVEDGEAPMPKGQGRFEGLLPTANVPTTAVAWTIYMPEGSKIKKRTIDGSLRRVDYFTPIEVGGEIYGNQMMQVQEQANFAFEDDAMKAGVQPVRVSLPIDGQAYEFEKLLVLDEDLSLTFNYRGLK